MFPVAACAQTYGTSFATGGDTMTSFQSGVWTFGVSSACSAPSGGFQNVSVSCSGTAALSLTIDVTSATQPVASGTCTIDWTYVAQAGAGSHVNCSSHGEADAEFRTASATATGAQVSNDGPNTSVHTFTLSAAGVTFVSTGMNTWRATILVHNSTLTASTEASAPLASKGSSATASASFSVPQSGLGITSFFTIS
jgi:hypothetical protein